MTILAIDTSCDETAAAVVKDKQVLSNIIWSSASQHNEFGGILPSLAARAHTERIGWVVNKSLTTSHVAIQDIDAIAVTVGPGLAIALEIGINKAKELAIRYKKPLIGINHVEGHLLSPFAESVSIRHHAQFMKFPCLGFCISGGNTILVKISGIGGYEVLAETCDDALGEALDKAARLLGLGYPGAPFLEKLARLGNPKKFRLPIPLVSDPVKNRFSYSGLKAAFVRLYNTLPNPSKQDTADLAACFQNSAFEHILRVLEFQITNHQPLITNQLLFGGGVANNIELKKRLRKLLKKYNMKLLVPYSKKLNGDNAAMIGVCAWLKFNYQNLSVKNFFNYNLIDRDPRLKL